MPISGRREEKAKREIGMLEFLHQPEGDAFRWESLGDIRAGRENLGEEMPVWMYRLAQYTMRDVLAKRLGHDGMVEVFREAGYVAGKAFAEHVVDLSLPVGEFFSALQKVLEESRMGVLRIEAFEKESGSVVLTVSEDLDCSGLPVTGTTVCNYDEGFLRGVLEAYTKHPYAVTEVDCWATGARVCRFQGTRQDG
ncbi:MAG: V4R domain-containing protein [Schwartzia sp. (in: firmicutes)]